MSAGIEVICRCCDKLGNHHARGLRRTCYSRHADNGTLHQYPRLNTRLTRMWRIQTYRELAATTPSQDEIAARLEVSVRTTQRYAADLRQLDTTEVAA